MLQCLKKLKLREISSKTVYADVSLGEEKKVLSLFFVFCYYGSKLLQNSPFYLNRKYCRRIPWLIEDLNSVQ